MHTSGAGWFQGASSHWSFSSEPQLFQYENTLSEITVIIPIMGMADASSVLGGEYETYWGVTKMKMSTIYLNMRFCYLLIFSFALFIYIFASENIPLCVSQCLSILSLPITLRRSYVLPWFHQWLNILINCIFILSVAAIFCQTYMCPVTNISVMYLLLILIWLNIFKTFCIWGSVHMCTDAYFWCKYTMPLRVWYM